jgi:hypothetical protein
MTGMYRCDSAPRRVLGKVNGFRGARQHTRQPGVPLPKRRGPDVRAIKLQQVESEEAGSSARLAAAEQSVEIGPAAFVAGARLAVEDEALKLSSL